MIVTRQVVPGLALCVALATFTTVFYAGVGAAPVEFFGGDDVFLVAPPSDQLLGQTGVPAALAGPLRQQANVILVSPEIYAPTTLGEHSVIVRGVEFAPFLQMERARMREGHVPEHVHAVLAGAGAARTLGLRVGDDVAIPGAFARVLVHAQVSGIFEADGPSNHELLVPLPMARTLTRVDADEVHLIRVSAEDPRTLRRLVESVAPTFTYSDVRLSATTFYPGQTVVMSANLTNWGRVDGIKNVAVRNEREVVAQQAYRVGPLQTVPVAVEFHVGRAGLANITINPTFTVDVQQPNLTFAELPNHVIEGREAVFRLVDSDGEPAAGAQLRVGTTTATTDDNGTARLRLDEAGRLDIVARRDEAAGEIAYGQTYVVAKEQQYFPSGAVTRLDPPHEEVGTRRPFVVRLELENRGGVTGEVHAYLTLDGDVVATANATLAPGETRTMSVPVGPVSAGNHTLSARNSTITHRLVAYEGDDPRIEALLRAYEARARDPQISSTSGDDSTSYIERTIGNVALAVLSLSIASGALATLGVIAVLARHLAERRHSLGLLKALGASDEHVLRIASGDAARHGLVASVIGVASGLLIALFLDRLEVMRGFGHAVSPSFEWTTIGLLLASGPLVVIVAARALAAGVLHAPPDALLRGRAAPRPQAPALHDLLGENR